ncbi:MAG TPA: zf-HC2 domain-containing protein, partial [Candidatus Krumholzibacteria bacterium]|nr:zf-HC2 domain-containing protein [Candidatus Krumholzibacteria bacterium]
MKCAEVEKLLDDFVDGNLAPDRAQAVREHTASCLECAAELVALEALRETTTELSRDIEPLEDLWQEIEAGLFCRVEYGREGRTRVYGWVWRGPKWNAAGYAWRLTAAAAIVLLVVAGVREWRTRGLANGAGWEVTTLQGAPVVGTHDLSDKGTLRPGEWLETDAASRARIDVADIGHVTVGPASALRLKGSSEKEH